MPFVDIGSATLHHRRKPASGGSAIDEFTGDAKDCRFKPAGTVSDLEDGQQRR